MENGLKELMKEIDLIVKSIESKFIGRIENIDYVRNKCREVLGYTDDIMWHICLNTNKLKDYSDVFLNRNASAYITFIEEVNVDFHNISKITNITRDDLYSMYNDYLINKKRA